jgi:hypothetical protein
MQLTIRGGKHVIGIGAIRRQPDSRFEIACGLPRIARLQESRPQRRVSFRNIRLQATGLFQQTNGLIQILSLFRIQKAKLKIGFYGAGIQLQSLSEKSLSGICRSQTQLRHGQYLNAGGIARTEA